MDDDNIHHLTNCIWIHSIKANNHNRESLSTNLLRSNLSRNTNGRDIQSVAQDISSTKQYDKKSIDFDTTQILNFLN